MALRRALHNLSRAVDRIGEAACLIMVSLMVIVTGAQIVFRVFFTALVWSEELTRYLLAWSSFIGASCVYRHAGHISITLVQDALPPRLRGVLRLVIHLLCAAFFALMIWYGTSYALRMGRQMSPAMRIPMSYMYAAISIGGVMMMLHTIDMILDHFAPIKDGDAK